MINSIAITAKPTRTLLAGVPGRVSCHIFPWRRQRAGLVSTRRLALWVVCGALLSAPALATEVGKITGLDGRADARNDNRDVRKLGLESSVFDKDVIRTKSDGYLTVSLSDGSRLSLAPHSSLEIIDYSADVDARARVKLIRGRVQLFVTKAFSKANSFIIETPQARIPVGGAELEISVGFAKTTIFVLDGDMQVNTTEGAYAAVVLYPGEGAVVQAGGGPVPVNHLSGEQGSEGLRIYSDIGSGSQQDLISAGIQTGDPANSVPTIPKAVPLPVSTNPP